MNNQSPQEKQENTNSDTLSTGYKAALVLGVFAFLGALSIAYTYLSTHEKIEDNVTQYILKSLEEVLPKSQSNEIIYNNNLLEDVIYTQHDLLGANEVAIYPAYLNDNPVGAILTVVTPDGYNGDIKIIVGITESSGQPTVVTARVVEHKETPGLGDPIDKRKSDWIDQYAGTSLAKPFANQWRVKKDGGEFDQLTGATITPRAVTNAIKQSLQFYTHHKALIFTKESSSMEQ